MTATTVQPGPDPTDLVGLEVRLGSADAHHARSVLRSRPGEDCEVAEPGGRVFVGVFLEVGREVVVRLLQELPSPPPERSVVTLVQALPALRKVDEIVEKGTEVGVARFVLVAASGSPRVAPARLAERVERWSRIAREAAKQSRQVAVPTVEAAASLEAAASTVGVPGSWSIMLDPAADVHLGDLLAERLGALPGARAEEAPSEPVDLSLWVGPEGGWSDDERRLLVVSGVRHATLGWRVLRTETAGPVAAALARFALGDR